MKNDALPRAVELVGGQSALARSVGVSQATVWYWLNKMPHAPAEFVVAIEAATAGKVTRSDLRPDLFGSAPALQADPPAADAPTRDGPGADDGVGGVSAAGPVQPDQGAA
jgi:DNA-binding transcriptional regulator YdaS (Cro superfamily)